MTTTALPLTNLAIENMVSAFSASLALDTQWRIQTNVSHYGFMGNRRGE